MNACPLYLAMPVTTITSVETLRWPRRSAPHDVTNLGPVSSTFSITLTRVHTPSAMTS